MRDSCLAACVLVVLGLACPCAALLEAGGPDRTPVPAGVRRQATESLPRTALPMVLVGVMVDSADPSRSACLVRCTYPTERRHASYLEVGAVACDLAEVKEIRLDAVVVKNQRSSQLELLPLQASGLSHGARPEAAEPVPEPAIVNSSPGIVSVEVPKVSVDHYLLNLTELLSSAQATPSFRDAPGGQRAIEGFELRQIRAGSVVEKVGLKDGDVVLEVNGEPLDSLPTVMRLFGEAQATGQAKVTVLRGGQRITFVFNTK